MPGASRKAPAPPVLDYPAPGAIPAGSNSQNSTGNGPQSPTPKPPGARPASAGPTALLALRVADLLRANGLHLPQPLTGHLPPALSGSLRLPGARRYWWLYLLGGLAVTAVGLRLVLAVAGALADPLTTLQYGEVRTTHLSVLFGLPNETSTSPSLVMATNDHGIGHIWLLPAGQAKQASIVEMPLTDIDPDGKLPLHLVVADMDRDGHPDLLVMPGDGPSMVYLLDTGKVALRPPTAEEQRRLVLPGSSR
jgi:hypothetical protein